MRRIIIQGSARSDGNTSAVVQIMQEYLKCSVCDLNDYSIGYFDYDFNNQSDDFIPLIEDIVHRYQVLIFATPVYWYSMSAQMKTFFDRISDCLKMRKDLGRALAGKKMAAISCGSDASSVAGFMVPFKSTAEYLDMNYIGDLHTWVGSNGLHQEEHLRVQEFCQRIRNCSDLNADG